MLMVVAATAATLLDLSREERWRVVVLMTGMQTRGAGEAEEEGGGKR